MIDNLTDRSMEMTFTVEEADLKKLQEVLYDIKIEECPWFEVHDKYGKSAKYYRDGLSGWVPCKERLPGEDGDYFVTVDPRYVPPGYRSTDVITWRDGKWVMADYFVLDSEGWKKPDFKVVELDAPIIAWMPLPEPYREGADE